MASKSNRQRAKERQARRRAEEGVGARPGPSVVPAPSEREHEREEVRQNVEYEVGAPPQDLGRSDEVIYDEPVLEDEEHFDPELDQPEDDPALEDAGDGGSGVAGPRGHRGGELDPSQHADRPRFVQFLIAVRAELARVQWPDRQTLVTLTGVVLGFVLIAGGYLGLLDAIFSRVIQAIL